MWGSEILSNLLKVTQLVNVRDGTPSIHVFVRQIFIDKYNKPYLRYWGYTLVNKTDMFSALMELAFWWDLNPGQFYSKVIFFLLDAMGL